MTDSDTIESDFMKKILGLVAMAILAFGVAGCGGRDSSQSPSTASPSSTDKAATPSADSTGSTTAPTPAAPAVPDEMQKAAEKSLGAETDVLLFGDLSKTGTQQILAVNKIKALPPGGPRGNVITRAVVLEKNGTSWKEILRCDEHLENPKGFLGGTPLAI